MSAPCGSWRVTRYFEGYEAEQVWCARTEGQCPWAGTVASRERGGECAVEADEAARQRGGY